MHRTTKPIDNVVRNRYVVFYYLVALERLGVYKMVGYSIFDNANQIIFRLM